MLACGENGGFVPTTKGYLSLYVKSIVVLCSAVIHRVMRLPPAGMVKRRNPPFARRVQTTAMV